MKTSSIKLIAGCILLTSIAMNSFGQATKKSTETSMKKPVKMEKSKVPAAVTETFVKEYPMTTYDNWYGYPLFADETDWYGYDPYFYDYEYPEYYVVDFEKDKTPYKAIYSKSGKKLATHRKLTSDLPAAVSGAIEKGEYKSWTVKTDKEEIFKDQETDQIKVYKIEVEKGKMKHILFYQTDGKLLKDKTIKS